MTPRHITRHFAALVHDLAALVSLATFVAAAVIGAAALNQ